MNTGKDILNNIITNIEKVIIGKKEAIEMVLVALLCRGHVLIEDIPGVGKTSLVSAMAKSINCSFKRIQFTPDILPSDITGFSLYNPKTQEFNYKPGAIMAQIILADEINRTSPKTQSSLLEVMEENTVTVDGATYKVPSPFMVLATQNPVEYLGTYPLPEAQLDRFFMKVTLGYTTKGEESYMLIRFHSVNPLSTLKPVAEAKDIRLIQDEIWEIHVDKTINDYIVDIVSSTRHHHDILLGASPRASLAIHKASRAWAYYNGREYVIPDDVQKVAIHIMSHRIILKQEAKLKSMDSREILDEIISKIKAPV